MTAIAGQPPIFYQQAAYTYGSRKGGQQAYDFSKEESQTDAQRLFENWDSQCGFVENCAKEYERRRADAIWSAFRQERKAKSQIELERRWGRAISMDELCEIKKTADSLSQDEALVCLESFDPASRTDEELCSILALDLMVFQGLDPEFVQKRDGVFWRTLDSKTRQEFDPDFLRKKMITVLISSRHEAEGLPFKEVGMPQALPLDQREGHCQKVASGVCALVKSEFEKFNLPPIDGDAVLNESKTLLTLLYEKECRKVVHQLVNLAFQLEMSNEKIRGFVLDQLKTWNFDSPLSDCISESIKRKPVLSSS